MIKKLTIAVIIYIACQFIAILLLSSVDFNSTTDEIEIEILEMEYDGHTYFIFSEQSKQIGVTHSPNCCNN